ncbi:uncharacterized protein Z520_03265 [Fonsecaea multimorphosa CBS 102226]|uniref:Transcription factor domain-containing protein n=1 Tax=Fonsecaea multimorphosa CBS 102226 TaxID=1442371 RepID=A0A0D2IU95_9EURO|nr:uncharacterized protein Z520_03265 [Fonsecaea multimorphosa CBS 102226]KIY00602.1 hypothetical protein Z520_03265 [Fonsecaea multimorphosa CBS 102226]OAL18993.1 hypothetical protein AYO22_10322 [Fonsecaea multimorphosa]
MPHIFVPPVATQRAHPAAWELSSGKNKRKRMKPQKNDAAQGEEEASQTLYGINSQPETVVNLDYTAVVSPAERLQRLIAKQPLDQPPPSFPFPHAAVPLHKRWAAREGLDEENDGSQASNLSDSSRSLHIQHLAALTTILHRSLLEEDFPRAARALGLIFREDIVSKNAAARTQGYMGIAAEVLLRNGSAREPTPDHRGSTLPFTHEGFAKAKRFYERLIVRHPYHKSWPEAVNAVDYYLAMFNIWIYVVQAQYAAKSTAHEDGESDVETVTSSPWGSHKKVRELEQADQIASRMDTCMATVPYMDEPELIRLRAMVALWAADLHEDCAYLSRVGGVNSVDMSLDPDSPTAPLNDDQSSQASDHDEHRREAARARDKARDLLSRLESEARSDGG